MKQTLDNIAKQYIDQLSDQSNNQSNTKSDP